MMIEQFCFVVQGFDMVAILVLLLCRFKPSCRTGLTTVSFFLLRRSPSPATSPVTVSSSSLTPEPVSFVGNQMETVGGNMRNFFSGFVDDFVLPRVVDPVQHAARLIPSKCINLLETSTNSLVQVKDNTVDSNANKPNEAPLVPKDLCHKPSSTGMLCHSEQSTSEISGHLIGETDSLLNKTPDKTTQVNLNSSTNSQNSDNRSEGDGVLYDESEISGHLIGETDSLINKTPDNTAQVILYSSTNGQNSDNRSEGDGVLYDESEISGHLIGETDSLINKTPDNTAQVNLNSSTNSQNLDNRSEGDGVLYDESLFGDATAFEYSDWGIENISDPNLDTDNIIKEDPLMNLEDKKTPSNRPVDELEWDSNTSTAHESSQLDGGAFICNENKEENVGHIVAGGLSSENLYESLNSPFSNLIINCNTTGTMDCLSVSSDIISSCGPFTTLSYDTNDEDYVSCSGTGLAAGSTVDFEDVYKDNDPVESCVIVEGGKISAFANTSRNKSYKKMIQDAFMSRKRLTKEYKQLALWYGDIDKELCKPKASSSKQRVQDLPDSEWELL
ncbi:hypothetical protein QVD17_14219 [Tagetes erecta]|uniref:Uncharacterized protein n=1 Tax=Tagetes erecta TaxID=13708 RepID=A0AAD8KWN4_TARER|nr:hypothetical protein QVD17_14219 [Tagetes erecta]